MDWGLGKYSRPLHCPGFEKLPGLDSNQGQRIQSPLCYRCTTGHQENRGKPRGYTKANYATGHKPTKPPFIPAPTSFVASNYPYSYTNLMMVIKRLHLSLTKTIKCEENNRLLAIQSTLRLYRTTTTVESL